MSERTDADSPIEAYLDELLRISAGMNARERRHLLAETEAHLRDDADAAITDGMAEHDAEVQALTRFGPASTLIQDDRHRHRTPLGTLVRQTLRTGVLLGGVGAVAVGISGLIALIIRRVGGDRAVINVPSDRILSGNDCSRWLQLDPHAHSCANAAIADWANETVTYRLALGLLGVVALLAFWWLNRRAARRGRSVGTMLSTMVSDSIAMTLFAVAGVWTLALGVDAVITSSGNGSGQWLSAAPVALAAAVFYATRLTRQLARSAT
jgi:hypothetical protein